MLAVLIVAINVLLESYSLNPVSSLLLSVHVQVMLVLDGALPAKLLGAVGIVSLVAVAVSLLVSVPSCGSVYVAVMVAALLHVNVPLLLVLLPAYNAVVRPAFLNTSVAAPVSVRETVSESVLQLTTTPLSVSALVPLRLPSSSVIDTYTLSVPREIASSSSKLLSAM